MLKRILIGAALFAASMALASPGRGPGSPAAHGGPGMRGGRAGMMEMLGRNLYPPEFVLRNRTELGLSDAQVTAIAKEIGTAHDKVQTVQDGLRAAAGELRDLLDKPQVDEAAALAAAGRAMDLERQIKSAHLGMMIRVKNLLTPDQQAKMKELRPTRRMMGQVPPGSVDNTAPAPVEEN